MDGVRELVLLGSAFAVCVLVEVLLLFWAPLWGWVSDPNDRSLHDLPTPTLGGLGCAAPILIYLGYVSLDLPNLIGLAVASAGLALVGLVDDLRELSRTLRLGCQLLAAGLIAWMLPSDWALPVAAAATLLLVWQVNLFNFMDGVDGLVGSAALFFCLAVQFLSGGAPGWLGDLMWVVSGALLGFLTFNWPPARIFMGDVGSTFLGILLGASVMQLVAQDVLPLASCLILLTGLWFDATYTICVRIVTGQPFVEAHRTHLYQKVAARKGHLWTASAFLAFCLAWLLPLAELARTMPAYGLAWQLIALLPMAIAAIWMRAGRPEGDSKLDC